MANKKRVLFVNESSFLSTGFAQYSREVMNHLHGTGKYELAELGCFSQFGDRRAAELPWKFFTNAPDPRVPGEADHYHSQMTYQYGEWRFEETCLQFRPDIVCDVRDWWMLEHQERSPFRRHFHWVIMPTVDAWPQEEQWLATFMNADGVLTYTDWALDVLRQQAGNSIRLFRAAPPGVDSFLRMTADKRQHKVNCGLPADALVVGTVMRNQRRKLHPDLIQAFAMFRANAPAELASRAYLYLHTGYPDQGWDIPRLINEAGIASRVLMTYHCQKCGHAFTSVYADARVNCHNCGQAEARLPNWSNGVSRDVMCKVFNLFDIYVQYSHCEGFGMPLVEAAGCGVPVAAVDYSAMTDVVRKLGGTPIRVQRLMREAETHRYLALPDNEHLASVLAEFLSQPESVRLSRGYQARKLCLENYSYERSAKTWEEYFDAVQCRPQSETWDSPASLHKPQMSIPAGLSDEEFVRWGICNIAGCPDLLGSYVELRMVRDLLWECGHPGMANQYANEMSMDGAQSAPEPFDRQKAANQLLALCEQRNHWEEKRCQR